MSGAAFIPKRFTQLKDTPSSYTGHSLKGIRVKADETGNEFYTPTDVPFAMAADWVNVQSYGAAGVVTTTTLAATLNSGSTSATLTSAASYAIGHGMAIPGAGVAGVELVVILTGVSSNVVSWTGATSTTVASGVTVYHDDTVAFTTALATGKNVYVPWGDFNIQGGQHNNVIQMTIKGQRLVGASGDTRQYTIGGLVLSGTVIYSRSLTKDCLQLVAFNTQVSDLAVAVMPALSASKTAGAGIVLGDATRSGLGASLGPCYGAILERVGISHFWDGLRVEFSSASFINKVAVMSPHRYGIYGTSGYPTGGNWFNDIQCYPLGYYSGTVQAGIYCDEMDTTKWTSINCIGFPINFHLDASVGPITQQIFTGFTNENASVMGIRIEGSQVASNNVFTGGELLVGGIYVGAAATNNTFTSLTIRMYATPVQHSVQIYGDKTKLIGVDIGGRSATTNSYDGIIINSGADGTIVVGCAVRLNRYGIVVVNGATNTIIQGNNFNENNTAGANLGTTTRTNAKISGNYGIDDYITSVASTPDFVGQLSLSGGALYMAVGTSSSADWKQITA